MALLAELGRQRTGLADEAGIRENDVFDMELGRTETALRT